MKPLEVNHVTIQQQVVTEACSDRPPTFSDKKDQVLEIPAGATDLVFVITVEKPKDERSTSDGHDWEPETL